MLYVVAYLAMGVPAVLGGVRLAATGDVLGTAREYGLVVMALAALALAGAISLGRASATELALAARQPDAVRAYVNRAERNR